MLRIAFVAATLSMAALTSPIMAAQVSGHYVATAMDAPQKASFVTHNTVWKCKDGVCAAPRTQAQDKVMCQRAAQRIGNLSAFTAGGTPFDAAALAACNASVK